MSVDHDVIEEAKGKAELRRKMEEFVEMLTSEDMSVKVKPVGVTPSKEATSDAKAARTGPLVKSKDFDGMTTVEAFLQQIKACANYYCWSDEECSIHLRCALIGDAATWVWSQLDPDDLSYKQLQTLLRERYGSAKQEEKYQAELLVRRRQIGEELPTLLADLTRLMALAYPGDVSAMSQMMARDYFFATLDESELALKITESEMKNLDDAYNCAIWLEMIRRGSQRKDQVDSPARRERNVRAVEADVSCLALNDEFQNKLEELQAKNLKQMEDVRQENKRNQEALLTQLSQLKPPTPAPAQTKNFIQMRCFTCGGIVTPPGSAEEDRPQDQRE